MALLAGVQARVLRLTLVPAGKAVPALVAAAGKAAHTLAEVDGRAGRTLVPGAAVAVVTSAAVERVAVADTVAAVTADSGFAPSEERATTQTQVRLSSSWPVPESG